MAKIHTRSKPSLAAVRPVFRANTLGMAGAVVFLTAAVGTAGASSKPGVAAAKADMTPLIAVVSIDEQHVTIWSGDTKVTRSSVSTGREGHRTPLGVFSVIGKEKYHESNLYSAAPMPFMQRITWSGVAMHGGNLPGYPASHGCIRMSESFAEQLYGMTRVGMRVIVANRDVSPTQFSHPALPVPEFVDENALSAPAHPVPEGEIPVAMAPPMQLGGPTMPAFKHLLNPMERGKREQAATKAAALQAKADAQALLDIASVRSAEARAALAAARDSDDALDTAKHNLDRIASAAAAPAPPVPSTGLATASAEELAQTELKRAELARADILRVQAERQSLQTEYESALRRNAAAHIDASLADAAAFRTAADAKDAIAERDALEQAARVAEHATDPISIFVSRKAHRVFVRQGFEPIFDADVEISDADTPLGTHVFTAVASQGEGEGLRWVSTTVPVSRNEGDSKPRAGKLSGANVRTAAALPPTAANALNRIKLPDDVMRRISAKLWTGASLIISDYGISEETGKGTDFVVLTR